MAMTLNQCLVCLALFAYVTEPTVSHKRVPIYIGGFFPLQGSGWDTSGILEGSLMALEDVNNNSVILPNYELRMIWNDSKVSLNFKLKYLYIML